MLPEKGISPYQTSTMNRIKIIFSILSLLSLSYNTIAQSWDLKVDKEGIKIYTRTFADSKVLEFKGEITVKANMGSILTLIDSIPLYPIWMYKCSYAIRLKKINVSSGYSYYVVKAPWPVSDRDACTYYKVTQDTVTKKVTVNITGVKDYIPKKDGRERVQSLTASWQLIPVSKGVTKIVYQAHCDIGGSVPAIIVNAYITDSPYYNLLHLRTIVEAQKYSKIVRLDVKEL